MINISKIRRSISIKLGMMSTVLCLVMGLIMDMRPFVILERVFICYVISSMLGYILVSAIGSGLVNRKKALSSGKEKGKTKQQPVESPSTERQNTQEA